MVMTGGGDRGVLALLLPWGNDNSATVWGLVYLLEGPENYQKPFGREPSEAEPMNHSNEHSDEVQTNGEA